MRNQKAFTLMELIVVMVVIGVMTVVAVPLLQNDVVSFKTKTALEDIRSMSRYCQRYAIETQRWCRVTFRTNDEEVRLHYSSNEATNGGWTQMTNAFDQPFEIQLGQGHYSNIDITDTDVNGSNSFMFDGDGVPHDRGSINDSGDLPAPITSVGTITFNGASGWELRIEPETGFITMVDL